MLHVRIEDGLKQDATEALSTMGLSVSDAVRVFLTRVVADRAIPFAESVPNAGTCEAIQEACTMQPARFGHSGELFDSLGKNSR